MVAVTALILYLASIWLAVALARSAARPPVRPPSDWLTRAFMCIHRYEGAWNDPNGPYYGGLQMDIEFQRDYGREFLRRYGTADHWPVWAQLVAARRAYFSGRGFGPWPNTRHSCGL